MMNFDLTLQNFLISRLGITVGLLLSRLPRKMGYPMADWLADLIARRKNNPSVRAVRANQWVVHNYHLSGHELDCIARNTYRNSARSLYEFWHFIGKRQLINTLVKFEPSFMNCIQQSLDQHHGLILAVAHLSNFDLFGQAAAIQGIPLHVLSFPNPPGGYQWQNKIRKQPNLLITPISVNAIRQASETLHNGGIVVTGIDRPLTTDRRKYPVQFFGRPAALPVFHIRLAIKNNVPVAVVGCCQKANGTYSVWASDLIYMKANQDLVEETVSNAENLLTITANNIERIPDQWAMFYPVWPEVVDQTPV